MIQAMRWMSTIRMMNHAGPENAEQEHDEEYRETVEEAKREAATANCDFDESEVGWSVDDDAHEMEVDAANSPPEPEDEEEVMMREKEKQRQEEHRRDAEGFPKWARRLQVGSKRLPDLGLTNVDAEEKCTRIFDHSLTLHILRYYKFYWKHRLENATQLYYEAMVADENGRLDLDGICPFHSDGGDNLTI